MIRHAKIFETAGHQLLTQVTALECRCGSPKCKGVTLGVTISIMGEFPLGLGLLQAQCEFALPPERLCQLVDRLELPHARRLLEALQATAFRLRTDEHARQTIEEVFTRLNVTVPR